MPDDIFDSSYVKSEKNTQASSDKSKTKEFLKETVKLEDMEKYGSSKPRRILIKAKISNG